MSKYRVAVSCDGKTFTPQVWRWWLPVWRPIASTTYTGYDWSDLSFTNCQDAWDYIDRTVSPKKPYPVYQYTRPKKIK
jgi:hypothetical protein